MKEQIRKERGITLIALVITIIVLLILAAISIAMLTGENGILTKASDSSFKQDSSAVLEKLKLEILDINADDKINNSETIKIQKLMEKGFIDSNNVVNVENLLANNKISTGKGTSETGDVYKLEKDENNAYDLNYYDKNNNKQQIGDDLFMEEDGSFPIEDYLDITPEGEIKLKNIYDFYGWHEEYEGGLAVKIPETINGITVTAIAERAFSPTYYIREIILPNTITKIGDSAFYRSTGLESIILSDNLVEIGNYAFLECGNLKDIKMKGNITNVGEGAFSQCGSLETVTLSQELREIPSECFAYCNSLNKIEIPSKVTTIGIGSFVECNNLEEVILHDNLNKIEMYAFGNCNKLKMIELPSSLTILEEGTFSYCTNLRSIEIPPLITKIPQNCFGNCSSLESVKIPKSVTTIEVSNSQYSNTFMNCEKVVVTVEAGSPLTIENFTAAGLKAEQVVFE